MDHGTAPPPQSTAQSLTTSLDRWAPHVLSIQRIVVALLFLQHGLSKLFSFPQPMVPPPMFTMIWFAGVIELVGGVLVTLGLFTRVAAFMMSGEMAIGYFLAHAPHGFFPMLNGGNLAILYCFVFLYLVFAGAGPWSLDAVWLRKRRSL